MELRLAVQRQGRLTNDTLALLHAIGLDFDSYSQRLFSPCRNFPLSLLYVRDDDIPEYVAAGSVDLGIVGENLIREQEVDVAHLQPLDFGYCSVVLAVPKESTHTTVADLAGTRIATSYPITARAYFADHGVANVEVIEVSGSVEVAPSLGLADAVVEITATGSTLRLNDLRPIDTVMESRATLVAAHTTLADDEKRQTIDRLLMRIKAVETARRYKYVMMNAPRSALDHIRALIPGLREPTVMPLADPDWVAVHAAIREETFWDVIEALHAAGASEILVAPVEKLVQ